MTSNTVVIDKALLPISRRLKIGKKYLKLTQPGTQAPLVWNFEEHPLFLQFLGYWYGRGYYEKYSVILSAGKRINELIPIIDYIAELFDCNYRIRPNKLIKFDSALLKYTMLGLGINPSKSKFVLPTWLKNLSEPLQEEFIKGYFIVGPKVKEHQDFLT